MSKKCDGECGSCSEKNDCTDPRKQVYDMNQKLKARMSEIKHKIAVISGKGGVGKSTVAVNLAMAFAVHGYVGGVGVLDVDIHGPCVPKMLGLSGRQLQVTPAGIFPVIGPLQIKVMSMAFLLQEREMPVIWRGPLKMSAIKQFLADVAWGPLTFLFIDVPPGTGDEPLSVMQLLPEMDGVVIVTIPSEVSQTVVKKAVNFARQLNVPIIGIIENMSGFICPKCGTEVEIFKAGGGKRMAEDMRVPFLGSIPLDPTICEDSDKGMPFVIEHMHSPATKAFMKIVEKIEGFLKNNRKSNTAPQPNSSVGGTYTETYTEQRVHQPSTPQEEVMR